MVGADHALGIDGDEICRAWLWHIVCQCLHQSRLAIQVGRAGLRYLLLLLQQSQLYLNDIDVCDQACLAGSLGEVVGFVR